MKAEFEILKAKKDELRRQTALAFENVVRRGIEADRTKEEIASHLETLLELYEFAFL